jgi:hypothetical protein
LPSIATALVTARKRRFTPKAWDMVCNVWWWMCPLLEATTAQMHNIMGSHNQHSSFLIHWWSLQVLHLCSCVRCTQQHGK